MDDLWFCPECGVLVGSDSVDQDLHCDVCGRATCSFERLRQHLAEADYTLVDALRLRSLTERMEVSTEKLQEGVSVITEHLEAMTPRDRAGERIVRRHAGVRGPELGRVCDRWGTAHRMIAEASVGVRRLARSQKFKRAWVSKLMRQPRRVLEKRLVMTVRLPNRGWVSPFEGSSS